VVHYYKHEYSNVHRAAHTLAARSTDAYEGARAKVQRFLGAGSADEIVFVRGTTEAVNLVANAWGRRNVGAGDEIILTTLEHHSNIVPWQFLAEAVGAVLRIVPVTDRGEVLLDDYGKLLTARTRMVAITHVSNALGTILPVGEMIQAAHRHGAAVLVDGAQAVSHFPVNVQALDADFYVLSGHRLFAPSGVGVLYGKKALLDEMPPWQGGGNMIQRVTFEKSTFADPPARFEAGTATLGPAVGLGAAIDYLDRIGMENVARHERDLLAHGTAELSRIRGLRLIGTAPEEGGCAVVRGRRAERRGDGQVPRPGGHRGARGSSLRAADHGSLRRRRHGAAVAGAVQHARGDRRVGARRPQGAASIRRTEQARRPVYPASLRIGSWAADGRTSHRPRYCPAAMKATKVRIGGDKVTSDTSAGPGQ